MEQKKDSKTIIITGGSKGIGADISKKFSQEGWFVMIASRKPTHLAEEFEDNMRYTIMDVQKEEDHIRVVEETLKWTGRLDCYINCAGFSKWSPVEDVDELFWNKMIDTNLKGTFWGCKTASTHLSNNGSIVNISSLAGKRGSAYNSVYCASKFGVNAITQSLAKELGVKGIRVNAVCPVYVNTDGLFDALEESFAPPRGQKIANYLEAFAQQNSALLRLPEGKEVADLCFYLASSQASAITGQCINLDCGVLPQ
jgi:NAD(P)-dependent dehydrogenase (short-subunit alcohol dehydrogenase family)